MDAADEEIADEDDADEDDAGDVIICVSFVWELMEEMISLGCLSFKVGPMTDDDEGHLQHRREDRGNTSGFDDCSSAPEFPDR